MQRPPVIISENTLSNSPGNEAILQQIESIRKHVAEREVSGDFILKQLKEQALNLGIQFDYDGDPFLPTALQYAREGSYCLEFEEMCGAGKTTLDETNCIAYLKSRLHRYHAEEIEVDAGLALFFRVLKHFSVFPLDSSSITEIDHDGFIRAVYFIDEPYRLGAPWKRTENVRLGGHLGQLRKMRRDITGEDRRRRFFRSMCIESRNVKSRTAESRVEIPVSVYRYPLSSERWVEIQEEEDERHTDLLDMISWVYPAIEWPSGTEQWRCYYYPVAEQKGLTTYKHHLDELTIATKDVKELIKILIIIKGRFFNNQLTISRLERKTSFLPDMEFMSWDIFNEFFGMQEV